MILTWNIIKWVLLTIVVINEIAALFTVFREKRDIAATWAWLLVLLLLPVIGFIFYAFLGRKLPQRRLERIKSETQLKLKQAVDRQKLQFKNMPKPKHSTVQMYRRTIMLFQSLDNAFLTRHNNVKVFTEGNRLFRQLFDDIEAAQKSINIEFYTIYNDQIGNELRTLLEQKAEEGVEIRVLYDSWGSMGVRSNFYNGLRKRGGYATPFLMTHSNFIDFRLNYRDHRKIVVIDGEIGYVGGFNVGDQYLGRVKKFGPWRDTHLRIIGGGVYSLQQRFIRDWNASVKNKKNRIDHFHRFFPEIKLDKNNVENETSLQIVSSGPESTQENIKLGYLRLINAATDRIWIQTPYLIPDDSVIDALQVAANSGVDVRIMIPCKPDHPFVYRATQYYARMLASQGITIYFYEKGFLHAKTIMVDGRMASVGSANLDFRSFKLNFEINSFIYDRTLTDQLEQIFMNDVRDSRVVTPEMFAAQSRWLRFKQTFSRLLSPIL
ncbi:MAG: cardiolipin synthase [Candidatus Limosilactobacillus merdavium]|uniref:Cardiolipin synthase n=1 Tax=Candidatus Limosilactobacillus merdavium TaxID=2838651 RepID=A0A9E2KTW5_9LACO|nr:cardiolipin synthase [Candidatus Limosilactobacillus merdavium]